MPGSGHGFSHPSFNRQSAPASAAETGRHPEWTDAQYKLSIGFGDTPKDSEAGQNALSLRRATPEQYAEFVYQYLLRGGEIEEPRDSKMFASADILFVDRDMILPSEWGFCTLNVLVAPGVNLTWAESRFNHHSTAYYMEDGRIHGIFPHVYSYTDVMEALVKQHTPDPRSKWITPSSFRAKKT